MSSKTEKQVAETNEKDMEKVSGGAFGKDWIFDANYEAIYKELGITHGKNTFWKDIYIYKGDQITKDEAYRMVKEWRNEHGLSRKPKQKSE